MNALQSQRESEMHLTHHDNQVNHKINSFVKGCDELPLSHSNIKSFNLAESRQLTAKFKHIARKIIPHRRNYTYNVLLFFADKFSCRTDVIYPSHKTISNNVGCCVRTVKTIMKELHGLGLIHCCRRGKMQSNLYSINYQIIEARPDLLEDYGQKVRGKYCPQLNNPKGLLSYNTKHDTNFSSESVQEEVKDDPGDEKPESTTDEVNPSKKNMALMVSLGITTFLKQSFYLEQWRLMMGVRKPKNGEEWNHKNANYLLEYLIRHEFNLKAKHKNKYIPPYTRFVFKNNQKPIEPKPIQCYSTHSTFKPDVDYREQWTPEEEKQHEEELQKLLKSFNIPPKEPANEEKGKRWN